MCFGRVVSYLTHICHHSSHQKIDDGPFNCPRVWRILLIVAWDWLTAVFCLLLFSTRAWARLTDACCWQTLTFTIFFAILFSQSGDGSAASPALLMCGVFRTLAARLLTQKIKGVWIWSLLLTLLYGIGAEPTHKGRKSMESLVKSRYCLQYWQMTLRSRPLPLATRKPGQTLDLFALWFCLPALYKVCVRRVCTCVCEIHNTYARADHIVPRPVRLDDMKLKPGL